MSILQVKAVKSSTGVTVKVQEGESCDLIVTFRGLDGGPIVKSNLISLVVSQYERDTLEIINDRDNQDILDANDGSVAADGTLTLRLGPDDAAIVNDDTQDGQSEVHILDMTWTWSDGTAIRTGRSDPLGLFVMKMPTPVSSS